jgi:hypothetical protein
MDRHPTGAGRRRFPGRAGLLATGVAALLTACTAERAGTPGGAAGGAAGGSKLRTVRQRKKLLVGTAREVARNVVLMDGGVIVGQGPQAEIMASPSTERFAAFLKRYQHALNGAPR